MVEKHIYSVYVGACEINDFYLTKSQAKDLKQYWNDEGYTDVQIVKTNEEEQ